MQSRGQNDQNPQEQVANDAVTSLSTKVLRKSKGMRVKDTDAVLVFYQGTLMNGDEFDANFDFSTFEAVENRFSTASNVEKSKLASNSSPFIKVPW